MTAADSVSPEQFGFAQSESTGLFRRPDFKPKMMDISGLKTRQARMDPGTVAEYAKKWPSRLNKLDPIQVVNHQGDNIVMNGHHRIAAARQKGKTKMRVLYGETHGETI